MSGQEVITADGEIITAPTSTEQMSLAIGLSKAEIDQQIATAKAYPRLVSRVTQNILSLVTIDETSAEECSYALPRGGKPIVGPSVRFAEIVAGQWGNCRVGARVVHIDRVEKFVEAEGIFHDLETNTATTARVRRRISNKNGGLLTDDMIIVTGNAAGSIAKRNAILGGVPKAVWRKAYEAAEKVMKGDVKTLAERRAGIFKAFAAFGVKPDQIFAALNIAGEDDITLEHIPVLIGMHSALKSGEATVEEMFGGQARGDGEKKSTSQKMNDFAKGENGQEKAKEKAGSNDGKKAETKQSAEKKNDKPKQEQAGEGAAEILPPTSDDLEIARDKGHDAFHNGMPRETCPREFNAKGREEERNAWLEGYDAAAEEEAEARN
ncbi:hypothetical protein [Brucella anthropi]|uniref:hypothetical protein n=1 Tax=Brucella anthropi TaxID=529 RepID=UPI00124DADF5|nr:hypothetical protein [Brucella anthropi]KAB2752319.1 hypothetical protein F9L05_04185 [Brucella anthropi]